MRNKNEVGHRVQPRLKVNGYYRIVYVYFKPSFAFTFAVTSVERVELM